MEEDKPNSMWEATQQFILESFTKNERQEWTVRFRAAGLNVEILEQYLLPKPKEPIVESPQQPKPKIVPQKLTCKRCNRTWIPRTKQLPIQCPKCHSPYWNKERMKK